MKILKLLSLSFILLFFQSFAGNNETVSVVGKQINDFSLRSTNNSFVSLHNFKDAKGFIVVFTCNHCPFAKLYPERLNKLSKKYSKLNVPLLAINSTDSIAYEEESFSGMVHTAIENEFAFPYLQDGNQQVAKNFGGSHTPQAFVLWKENDKWVVKYSGAIDDNGANPSKVTHTYVEDAVNALLLHQVVPVAETRSIGCAIRLRN